MPFHTTTPRLLFAGCLNIDLNSYLPYLPAFDDRVMTDGFQRFLGGMATNAACAAKALGQPYDIDIQLFAPCGNDSEGDWLRQQLTEKSIYLNALQPVEKTHYCLILVQANGDRLIISEPTHLNFNGLPALLKDTTNNHKLLYFDGLHTTQALTIAPQANHYHWKIAVDLDECHADYLDQNGLTQLSKHFDVIFLNQNTATKVAQHHTQPTHAIQSLLQMYSDRYGCLFINTLAALGAQLIMPNTPVIQIPAPNVNPIDTTGAGDVFAGVFCAVWAQQWDAKTAAHQACIAASLSTTARGAQGYLPSADALTS